MAFVAGKNTVLLADGVALTGTLNQTSAQGALRTIQATPYGVDDREFVAGLAEGSVTVGGMFEASTSDTELYDALDNGRLVTVTFGTAIGDGALLIDANETSYSLRSAPDDLVRLNATFQGTGPVRGGPVLHPLGAETSTGSFSSADSGASSAFGGVGHLHVSAFTGTNCTIKIQDSANNSTWADLITFSSVTGVTSQRSTVAGTVDRYLRANITAGTFTSVTFSVAFARHYR